MLFLLYHIIFINIFIFVINFSDEYLYIFFAELQRAPFKSARLSNGGVGIVCNYNNEDIIISAEHLFAMVLVKTKEVVANANGTY
jgi:hypothetical protein